MNDILKAMEANQSQIVNWFEHMHRNPELSMQEEKTAQYLAHLLKKWGFEVETGVGKHGIVASLTVGDGEKSIGLRADFDALPIQENNNLPYKSTVDGVAHLCGHDGHSAMLLAAVDNWEIEIIGKGGHGAMPELSVDPIVAGSSLVMALQTIVSRNVAPANSAVVTVGAFQSGAAGNVVAHSAILRLSIRTTSESDRKLVLDKVRTLTRTHAEGFGCTYEIRQGVPGAVLVNDRDKTLEAYEIAKSTFGDDRAVYPGPTFLGSEDFAFMLQQRPGTYCFIGNGDTPMVHHPEFIFNQGLLPIGAAYWVALTQHLLG